MPPTVPLEEVPVAGDPLLDGQGSAIADNLDEVVRTCKDAVRVVDWDGGHMLDHMGRQAQGSQPFLELLDVDAVVL